jgi:DNA polymerase-3 subunit delta'
LLLTAADADSLLPTITSRCRIIGLRPLPADLIETSLRTLWQVPTRQAHLLAHLADGRLGWAVDSCRNPVRLESRQEHLAQLGKALSGNRVARFALAEQLTRKPDDVPGILRSWLSWWRDLTLLAYMETPEPLSPVHITNIDQQEHLARMARTWNPRQIYSSFRRTDRALWQLQRNANIRLVLETLLLVYPLPEQKSSRGTNVHDQGGLTDACGRVNVK